MVTPDQKKTNKMSRLRPDFFPEINRDEVFILQGYPGFEEAGKDALERFAQCLDILKETMEIWATFKVAQVVSLKNGVFELEKGPTFKSEDLTKHFKGVENVAIIVSTLGMGPEEKINEILGDDPGMGMMLDSVASSAVESCQSEFIRVLKKEHQKHGIDFTPPFSPGYGDWTLDAQSAIFSWFREDGFVPIELNDSYLMTPRKSLTSIVGWGQDLEITDDVPACMLCDHPDCPIRDKKMKEYEKCSAPQCHRP